MSRLEYDYIPPGTVTQAKIVGAEVLRLLAGLSPDDRLLVLVNLLAFVAGQEGVGPDAVSEAVRLTMAANRPAPGGAS